MTRVLPLICGTLLLALGACAPKRPSLPSGSGSPFPGFAAAYDEATAGCRDARTVVAVLGLSGRAGGTRLRGQITAGLEAPESIRLDAVAFGRPIFILAGRDGTATLLLPRDGRVIPDAPAQGIVEALAGVALTPAELRAAIAGCGLGGSSPSNGRMFSDDWAAVDLGTTVTYLRRIQNRWHVAAAARDPLTLLYDDFGSGGPGRVFLRTASARGGDPAADIALSVSELEINVPIDPKAFVVNVPPDADPLTLEELRRAGPLGERR